MLALARQVLCKKNFAHMSHLQMVHASFPFPVDDELFRIYNVNTK
jgi:hypothetical protein